MRHLVSAAVGRPVRVLSRRLPRFAGFARRLLERSKDGIVSILPKRATAYLLGNRWIVGEETQRSIAAYTREPARKRRIVFVTAIFGGYDTLLLPEFVDPDVDYVCFTDRPRNTYGVWRMRSSPYYHPDTTRIARWVKTHLHELFGEYDVAVWLDANVILKGDIHRYLRLVSAGEGQIGLVPHPHRDSFWEEAEACKRLGKDSAAVIDRQVDEYRRGGLPATQPLFESGFMVVDLTSDETAAAFKLWWRQIESFSRRDQLGLAWVMYRIPSLRIVPLLPRGVSLRDHQDFVYFRHIYARALVVPDALMRAGMIEDPMDRPPFTDVKDERLARTAGLPVDIIVCVHNALDDVRLCLSAALDHLEPGHRIILVNDCSDDETTAFLRDFAQGRDAVTLIENESNLGYTRSANRGLEAGTADFRILLNSDTIVSRNWALKMLDVALCSDRIGIVSPLSNAAGAQSIPSLKNARGNTAINALPDGLTPADLDLACESWSAADLVPRVPLAHGFCFGISRNVIDAIGLFDDENFKLFYGEENDYCFRAVAAGYELAVATNTFVFHRKSRSIDEEKRVVHMAEAWKRLRELYGAEKILAAYQQVEKHPQLERIRRMARPAFRQADVGR